MDCDRLFEDLNDSTDCNFHSPEVSARLIRDLIKAVCCLKDRTDVMDRDMGRMKTDIDNIDIEAWPK